MALAASAVFIVALGCLLPFTPVGAWLGLVPLPASFFAFLVAATAGYLALVETVKRLVVRRTLA